MNHAYIIATMILFFTGAICGLVKAGQEDDVGDMVSAIIALGFAVWAAVLL